MLNSDVLPSRSYRILRLTFCFPSVPIPTLGRPPAGSSLGLEKEGWPCTATRSLKTHREISENANSWGGIGRDAEWPAFTEEGKISILKIRETPQWEHFSLHIDVLLQAEICEQYLWHRLFKSPLPLQWHVLALLPSCFSAQGACGSVVSVSVPFNATGVGEAHPLPPPGEHPSVCGQSLAAVWVKDTSSISNCLLYARRGQCWAAPLQHQQDASHRRWLSWLGTGSSVERARCTAGRIFRLGFAVISYKNKTSYLEKGRWVQAEGCWAWSPSDWNPRCSRLHGDAAGPWCLHGPGAWWCCQPGARTSPGYKETSASWWAGKIRPFLWLTRAQPVLCWVLLA